MTTISQSILTGGCQCRSVTFTSTSLPDELTNCHCLTCRKISGAPYLTFARFPTASLTFTSKPNALKTTQYSKMATRSHCGECGSPISMLYKFQPHSISITAGSIDEGSIKGALLKPTEHIFLAEKAAWFEVPDDGIQRFERFPDGFEGKVHDWNKGLRTSEPGEGSGN